MGVTLGELARSVDCEIDGDAALEITGVATLARAGHGDISFLANPRYRSQLAETRASAVILSPGDAQAYAGAKLVSRNPYLVYARVARFFARESDAAPGVHPAAVLDPRVRLGADVHIAPGTVIEAGAEIADGAVIGPNCWIGPDVRIGKGTRLIANVSVSRSVRIGERCLLHPGVVIGADGFGLARDGERWEKVPQLGSVRIGDDVEIGANTTIDRGALEDTVIEDGVKLDNQIQVAHNVRIGAHTAIAGCTAIAGSSIIGKRCMIAGGVGIAGHLEIADDVTVLAMTLVTHTIREKGVYSGSHPMEEVGQWRRNSARLRQLDELAKRVRELEKKLKKGGE